VRRDTLNIDPDLIEAAITPRTRAIMPVHLMGKPAPMDEILSIAARHGLTVVEDAAEAHGALYKGRPVGSIGAMGAFSLYIAHIITTGEGGIVTTDDPEFAEILRSLRAHGRACACKVCTQSSARSRCAKRFAGREPGEDIRFRFDRVGYSAKMNELEAAIGLGNMDNFERIVEKRRENLLYVLSRFARFAPHLVTICEDEGERIGPHAIPIVLGKDAPFTRDELGMFLEEEGIETRTLFASMPTQCPGFAYLGHRLGQFPNAEYLGRRGLHVGVHQDLGTGEMEYLLDTLGRFLESRA
jgi:dTDP-4-amino-4,6-dideoxygalactose transaminase